MLRQIASTCALAALLSAGVGPLAASAIPQDPNPAELLIDNFPQDPVGAIERTRELIAAGKMDTAIKRLETYVAAHPYDIAPRRFLGDLYFRAGQIDRAKFVYQMILQNEPQDKETHNRLGTVYAVQNRVDDAIKEFNAALPGTDSVGDLVALHERKGDLRKYRDEMERIANQYPNDPVLQAELAQVYLAIHQPELASEYFGRALDQDPRNITARNGLGLAMMALHHYPGAAIEFQSCLGIAPRTYQCENNLGAAQLNAGDLTAAKKTLDIAFSIAPERAETFVNFGYLADAQGDWHAAVAQYAKAIAMWPYVREAYIDIAIAYEDHQLYPLAQAALLKGLASVPDDGRMRFLLGRAYAAQGKHDAAVEQFRLAAQGSDPEAAGIAKTEFAALSDTASPKPQQH